MKIYKYKSFKVCFKKCVAEVNCIPISIIYRLGFPCLFTIFFVQSPHRLFHYCSAGITVTACTPTQQCAASIRPYWVMFLLIFASTAEYSAAAVLLFGSIVLLVGLLMLLPRRFHWAIFCFSTLLLQLSQLPFTQALNISLFNNNFASVWWIFDFLVYKF